MHPAPSRLIRLLGGGAAALALTLGPGAAQGSAASGATAPALASTTLATRFCPPAAVGHRSCLGLALARSAPRPAVRHSTAPPAPGGGYGPQEIQSAYGLSSAASTNGGGQTIALIEAFRDPAAAADLAAYRGYFGLPACTVATGCFQQVDMSGGTGTIDSGWEEETSLDMDAVSAACPRCKILLVESVDDTDPNLIAAIQRATSMGATVMNLSFGGCENGIGNYDSALHQANMPIAVATGDNGYFAADNDFCPSGTPFGVPEYPASSPYVTAVGGTTLRQGGAGRGWSETAWQYSLRYGGQGGGSGCSGFEPKPTWQTDRGCATRTVADVSADADPATGIAVFVSDPAAGGGWNVFGGTSLSAPLVAAMYALSSAPAAAVDGQIWYLGATVNDVTSGTNAALASDCNPTYLCNAGTGYDGPTGVGTPSGAPVTAGATDSPGATYTSLTPYRIADTRSPYCTQCGSGHLIPYETRTIQVSGSAPNGYTGPTVPASASAVVLNVTAVSATAGTYLSVFPTGAPRPNASSLNSPPNRQIANLVTVALGTGGRVDVFNNDATVDLVVDVEGYYSVASTSRGEYHTLPAPVRVCDSRGSNGNTSICSNGRTDTPLLAGESRAVRVDGGSTGIPTDGSAASVVLNLTGVVGTSATYLTVFPPDATTHTCGAPPTASNLNLLAYTTQPNRVITPVDPVRGTVCVFNAAGTINFIVDVGGWYGNGSESSLASGTTFHAMRSQRICDTRPGQGTVCEGLGFGSWTTRHEQVTSQGGLPASGIKVVVLNATILAQGQATYMSVYPDDAAYPGTSDLNAEPYAVVANLVMVSVAFDGKVAVTNANPSADLIADAVGWFA